MDKPMTDADFIAHVLAAWHGVSFEGALPWHEQNPISVAATIAKARALVTAELLASAGVDEAQLPPETFANAAVYAAIGPTIARLVAEMDALREALRECADDLEGELKARYFGYDEEIHPSQQGRFDRDMAPVIAARAALKLGE